MRLVSAIAKRGISALATLVVLSMVVYFGTRLLNIDAARLYLGKTASAAQLARFRAEQGLTGGPVSGYLSWLNHVIHGNWGTSIISQVSVVSIVGPRIVRTMMLAGLAFLIGTPIAVGLGIAAGKRVDSRLDVGLSVLVMALGALPEFVVGVALLSIFAISLGWLPVTSQAILTGTFASKVEAYVLPAATLALIIVPHIARQVRMAVSDAALEPHVSSARMRGLSPRVITWRHLIPNAAGRVVNVIGLSFALLLSGVVVVETVFSFPGLGQELVTAVGDNDVPAIQLCALVIGAVYIATNLVADAVVLALNPRLRRSTVHAP